MQDVISGKDLSDIDFASAVDLDVVMASLKELPKGKRSVHVFKRILYNYTTSQFLSWSSDRERGILAFVDLLDKEPDGDVHAAYVCSYVTAFSDAVRVIGGWEKGRQLRLYASPDPDRAAEAAAQVNAGEGVPREIVRGHVASLFDRELAYKYYSAAKVQSDVVKQFYIDQGINTYFSSIESLPRLVGKPEYQFPHSSSARLSVVLSMDAGFCSAYLPLVIHYVRHLPEFHYHFVFVGDGREVSACEEMLETLLVAQEKCAGRKIDNFSYSRMSVPASVKDKVTLYACARYFAAADLLGRFEGVYIMDVDIQLTADPTSYFSSFWGYDVCLPETLSLGQLMPWRRFMAGNVFVRDSLAGRAFLHVVCDYMRAGLLCNGSWTLDQNALCYAMEVMDVKVFNLNTRGRPTSQHKINKLFETGVSRWWVEEVASSGWLGRHLDCLRRFVR
jgi:hypothetical protein